MKKLAKKPGPGRPGRLSAEDAAGLTDRLLDAALVVFNRQGFSDSSMEDVARQAGASTKTIYSRYANKVELCLAVANRMVDRTLKTHEAAAAPDPSQVDPRLFLNALGHRVLTAIGGEGAGLVQVAISEARRIPELATMYDEVLARARAFNAFMFRGWRERGLFPAMDDPDYAAVLWVSLLTDMARIRVAMGKPMTEEEIARYVPFAVDFFLRGCGYSFPA